MNEYSASSGDGINEPAAIDSILEHLFAKNGG